MIAKFPAALALALLLSPAWAQEYPVREIHSICNFAAGSGADIIVRYYSERLSKLAGKPVLVENKPGVQGTLASDFVAKARPDGYTLMITPASSTLATAPYIFKKLPFDPLKDFAPVTSVASLSFVLAVDAAKPIKSIDELVKVLKSKPKRQSALPDIPMLSELGLGGFDIAPWFGVVVPAGTPRPIIDRLAGWFNQITNSADAMQFLARAALDAFPGSPESMAAHLQAETRRWERWVKMAKIEPQ